MDPTMDFRNYHRWGWDEISSANEPLIQSLSWICVQSLNCVTRSLFLCLGFSPQGKFRCVIHWSSHQILYTFQSARHWTSPLSFLSSASAFNVSFLIIMLCCLCWWIIKLNPPPSTCFDDVELHIPSRFAYKTIFPFVLRHLSHSAQLSSAASSRSSELSRNRLSLFPIFHLFSQPKRNQPNKNCVAERNWNEESCCFPWQWANNLQELLLLSYKRSPVNVALLNIGLLLYCVRINAALCL